MADTDEIKGIAERINALEAPVLKDQTKGTLVGEAFRYTMTTLHKLDFYTDCMVCCLAIHVGYENAVPMTLVLVIGFIIQVAMSGIQAKAKGDLQMLSSLM